MDIIGNEAAIRVNQQWSGHPGFLLDWPMKPAHPSTDHPVNYGVQLWAKRQPVGAFAVLLINASPNASAIYPLAFSKLNMTAAQVAVTDIWTGEGVGNFTGTFSVPAIAPYDSGFFLISPSAS